MQIQIRYFASLVERTGRTTETLDVAPGIDVRGLWRELIERHPRLADVGYRPLVACDRTYVDWGQCLDGVGEVAFLPPVAGG